MRRLNKGANDTDRENYERKKDQKLERKRCITSWFNEKTFCFNFFPLDAFFFYIRSHAFSHCSVKNLVSVSFM